MPKFRPAPASVVAIFEHAVAELPAVEKRKMFGYPCAFVRGQMLCGVFADRIMLRLSDEDRTAFLRLEGAKLFEPFPGRPMHEYVELPPEVMHSPEEFSGWLRHGLAYVESLPPKERKTRSKK